MLDPLDDNINKNTLLWSVISDRCSVATLLAGRAAKADAHLCAAGTAWTAAARLQGMTCRSYIELDLPLLIDSAFAAGAAMISFGAVLGKTPPAQVTWLLLLQVPLYAANAYLATEVRQLSP